MAQNVPLLHARHCTEVEVQITSAYARRRHFDHHVSWAYEDAGAAGTPLSRECMGGAMLIPALASLPQALRELETSRAQTGLVGGLAPGTLHVMLTRHGETALTLTQEAYELIKGVDVEGYAPSDCEDSRRSVDPKAVAAAATAQIRALAPSLLAAGFTSVSVMSKRGKLAPLRTVLYFSEAVGTFVLEPVLGLVEPPTAGALELRRLSEFPNATYSSSRNRQWHIYSVTERQKPHSAALRRVFLRGVVRQLGRPDLLAAIYGGNAAGAAAAAMEEVELTVAGALGELERIGNTQTGPPTTHCPLLKIIHLYDSMFVCDDSLRFSNSLLSSFCSCCQCVSHST